MRGELEKQLRECWYVRKPMKENRDNSAEKRWMEKAVEDTRKIPLTENDRGLRLSGTGYMGVDTEFGVNGEGSVYMDFPVENAIQNPSGRAYSDCEIYVPFEREDLNRYNRLSFWVYADAPGSSGNFMMVKWHNAGKKIMPVPGRFEGFHSMTPENGKWTRVIWEMPNVARDCTTAISVCAQAYGTSMPAPSRIRIFIADMRLEKVKEDSYKGFGLREGAMAYCHSGYKKDAVKQAMIQKPVEDFALWDEQGKSVFQGRAEALKDGFYRLDFTDFSGEGWYTIHAGEIASKPFPIGTESYLSAAWKAVNFFFAQRCGCSVPGIHTECHLDVMSIHPNGRRKPAGGGWHDAGDLSQNAYNTADSALALLELAGSAGENRKELGRRALEEARWGIDWLIRGRWGDGYAHVRKIIGFWSKNVIGDEDDLEAEAENCPYNNLLRAGVFASAYRAFEKEDPMYAGVCKRCAMEDYAFGTDCICKKRKKSSEGSTQIEIHARAAWAAAKLYQAFGGEKYLQDGAGFAGIVMNCQQQMAIGFSIPLAGYFYESEEKQRTLSYFHRSYEHVPIQALSLLVRLAPDHEEAPKWKESLRLYGEYLKTIYDVTPYGVLPAGIYELDNTDYAGIYHEGDHSLGAPSMEEYNAQVRNGIRLDKTRYLRIFPVAYQFRGFHAPIMDKAIGAMEIAKTLGDEKLKSIATRQMEWILGFNPFACSSMYGEGYDYHPLYSGVVPQVVGAVPVGFECCENEDEPYFPMQNLPTYKEIWVHTTCRMIKLISYLGFDTGRAGFCRQNDK